MNSTVKYIISALLFMVIAYACNSDSNANKQSSEDENFIADTLKSTINHLSKEKFSNVKIYAIRITKLHKSTIVNIEPVYYNDYLKEYGNPENAYLYDSSLFLLYCGIEAIKKTSNNQNEVQNQFNNFCSQHGIGAAKNVVHDALSLFFKIENGRLIPYSRGYEKEFYKGYNELEEVKPFFTPDKSFVDSL